MFLVNCSLWIVYYHCRQVNEATIWSPIAASEAKRCLPRLGWPPSRRTLPATRPAAARATDVSSSLVIKVCYRLLRVLLSSPPPGDPPRLINSKPLVGTLGSHRWGWPVRSSPPLLPGRPKRAAVQQCSSLYPFCRLLFSWEKNKTIYLGSIYPKKREKWAKFFPLGF